MKTNLLYVLFFLLLFLVVRTGFSQCTIGTVTVSATPSTTSNQVTVNWNGLNGASDWTLLGLFYAVDYGIGNFATVKGANGNTSAVVTGLTFGATYSFRVNITDACQNIADPSSSSNENFFSVNTVNILIIPDTPTLIGGTSNSSTTIDISWNAVTGAASYDYEISNTAGTVVKSGNIAATSTTITGLTANTNYFYRIRARNTTGPSINFSTKSSAILTRPDAPTFPAAAATAITTTSFKANWNAVAGASSYQLEVSADQNFNTFVTNPTPLLVNGTISPDITGLAGGTTYYYHVRAVNSLGAASVNSTRNQALTAPVSPTGFSVGTTTASSITVNWIVSPTATQYELSVATDQNFNFPLAGYNPKIVLSTTLTDAINNLTVSTPYYMRIRAQNGTSVYSEYAYTSGSTTAPGGGGIKLDDNVNEPSHISGTTQALTANLSGTPTGNVTVTLYHKKNSQTDYVAEPVSLVSGKYKITLDDSWFDSFGMEFYFHAQDQAAQVDSKHATIVAGVATVTIPVTSFGKEIKNYQIISLPYALPGRQQVHDAFEQITGLGSYDKKKWRLFQYKDGANVEYSEGISGTDLKQGTAYWFISRDAIDLTLGQGNSFGNSLTSPFTLSLKKGWNQIGNPFPYSLSWQDITTSNGNTTAVGKLITFSSENSSFVESDFLPVFGGGFVFADRDLDLTFPISLPRKTGGRIGTSVGDDESERVSDWILPIIVSQNEITNTLGGIGMNENASDGKDRYDRITPPRFLDYLEFNSTCKGCEYELSRSVVNAQDQYTWQYSIGSNAPGTITLRWDKNLAEKTGGQVILHDLTNHTLTDMALIAEYSCTEHSSFAIHYNKMRVVDTDQVLLGMPYPNPFQTAITIPLDYLNSGEEMRASMIITDVTGRIIVTSHLQKNQMNESIPLMQWNGLTADGNTAASGLYVYRLAVTKKNGTTVFHGTVIKK